MSQVCLSIVFPYLAGNPVTPELKWIQNQPLPSIHVEEQTGQNPIEMSPGPSTQLHTACGEWMNLQTKGFRDQQLWLWWYHAQVYLVLCQHLFLLKFFGPLHKRPHKLIPSTFSPLCAFQSLWAQGWERQTSFFNFYKDGPSYLRGRSLS